MTRSQRVSRLISKLEKWIDKRRVRGLEFAELAEAVAELRVLHTFYVVHETQVEADRLRSLNGAMRRAYEER